jgi:hypothetical protein
MSAEEAAGLLAYVPSFKGERAIVLNCDSISLTYLGAQLDSACAQARLNSAATFEIGNHLPILSDDLMVLKVKVDPAFKNPSLTHKAGAKFILKLTLEAAIAMNNKLKVMINYGKPCHQFFTFQDSPLEIVITIGEYTDDERRSMRGHPTSCF